MLGASQPGLNTAFVMVHPVQLDVGHGCLVEDQRFSVFLSTKFYAIPSTGESIKTVPIIEILLGQYLVEMI